MVVVRMAHETCVAWVIGSKWTRWKWIRLALVQSVLVWPQRVGQVLRRVTFNCIRVALR